MISGIFLIIALLALMYLVFYLVVKNAATAAIKTASILFSPPKEKENPPTFKSPGNDQD
jgi:hypothetical protein